MTASAHRHQRGAVGLFGTFTLGAALLFMVLASDVGRIAYEKRELQQVADLAALTAVKAVGACAGPGGTDVADARDFAQATAAANGYDGDLATEAGAVEVGIVSVDADGLRQFSASDPLDADGVRVTARRSVPASLFAGGWFGGQTTLTATAVTQREAMAGLSAGSYLARIDTTSSPLLNAVLGGLLGGAVNLDVLGYQGLLAAPVRLGTLAANLGVGTMQELLDADVSVSEWMLAMVDAVNGYATAEVALGSLAAVVGNDYDFAVGELLYATGQDPEAALDASINAFDLAYGAILLANEQHFVSVPLLSVSLPPLASIDLSLYVVEGPQIAFGPPGQKSDGSWRTEVRTAQLRLALSLKALELDLGALAKTGIELGVVAEVAPTTARLASIECNAVAADGAPVRQATVEAQPGIARLAIGEFADIEADASINLDTPGALVPNDVIAAELLGGLLGLTPIEVNVRVGADTQVSAGVPQTLTYELRQGSALPLTQTVDSDLGDSLANAVNSLAESLTLDVRIETGEIFTALLGDALGGLLDGLIGGVLGLLNPLVGNLTGFLVDLAADVLNPVLAALSDTLLEPLFGVLGLSLGGADVTLVELKVDSQQLAR